MKFFSNKALFLLLFPGMGITVKKKIGGKMAKIKNESSSYWNALTQLIAIIKTEYPAGGKLPPAPEMSRRLNVSRMTYGKALKTVCTHGLASASRGRGGTLIPPPVRSRKKIGLMLLDGAESPFVTRAEELSAILMELRSLQYQQHIIQSGLIEKLYEKLVIYNISGVICIDPESKLIEELSRIRTRYGFPIVATCFRNYRQEAECRKAGVPIVQHDLFQESAVIVDFLAAKGFRNPMLIDGYFGFVDVMLNRHFRKYGIFMPEENCLLSRQIPSLLLKRIRKQKIDVLILEGGFRVYRPVFELLMQLPKSRRPAVLLRNSPDLPSGLKEMFPEIRILGRMTYDAEALGRMAASVIAESLENGAPPENVFINNFSIL